MDSCAGRAKKRRTLLRRDLFRRSSRTLQQDAPTHDNQEMLVGLAIPMHRVGRRLRREYQERSRNRVGTEWP